MQWLWAWILSLLTGLNNYWLDPQAGYVVPTQIVEQKIQAKPSPTRIPTAVPTKKIIISPKPTIIYVPKPKVVGSTEQWGISKQIGEVTWTMRVGEDAKMATPKEVLDALNVYRVRRGVGQLTWDDNLAKYAQTRADYLASIKSTDEHKGFIKFLDNENGFEKLGFTWLGENISYGYRMEAVHLIEWLYAGDKPHDDNQVNSRWNYVGVGINGTANAIIFGTGKR